MADAAALALALVALAVAIGAAVARLRLLPEAVAAVAGAGVLVASGAIGADAARDALGALVPTVGLLAALLVLGDGCRREGLFTAIGERLARGARDRPRRLLALVFAAATAVTAVLSLDATVVLLTPVVFATAARLRTSPRPHVYACSHLANSASLLLPVSNLTNLLAFHASALSFTRFAGLMALPTAAAVAVEWSVISRVFAVDLGRPRYEHPSASGRPESLPRHALLVVAATLAGFAASSVLSLEPVWVAVAGAVAMIAPALVRHDVSPRALLSAVEPGLIVFVLALGVIVRTAGDRGLSDAVGALLPGGDGLAALLAIAALSALLANLVNNLPATLILVGVLATAGPGPVLAALIGVNIGPNLTYVGSLATLLWRRIVHAQDAEAPLGEFTRLGLATVPAALLAATTCLWLGLQVL